MSRRRNILARLNATLHPAVARAFRRLARGRCQNTVLTALLVGYSLSDAYTRSLLIEAGTYRPAETGADRKNRLRRMADRIRASRPQLHRRKV